VASVTMDSSVSPQVRPRRSGILHQYNNTKLTAFEHTPKPSSESAKNIIIFIGGLFDGFMTVKYASKISDSLDPKWTLAEVLLSSSYAGWGTSSLVQDAKELHECVSYFKGIGKEKVVLMGHSTGCQDTMEYLTGPGHEARLKNNKINGAIIQAPVSDREAFAVAYTPIDKYNKSITTAQELVSHGKGDEILPKFLWPEFLPAPITASRWLSLTTLDGADDYFSSDLKDEQLRKTFGNLPKETKLCILFSGSDEYVPETIDKKAVMERWIGFVKESGASIDESHSGILDGAAHNLNTSDAAVVDGLVKRVIGFLSGLD